MRKIKTLWCTKSKLYDAQNQNFMMYKIKTLWGAKSKLYDPCKIKMANCKRWKLPPPRLLAPVKSFICFQSLIIFLITLFVPGRNFRVWNKSQIFLPSTKFVTGKPELRPIWHLRRNEEENNAPCICVKLNGPFFTRLGQTSLCLSPFLGKTMTM